VFCESEGYVNLQYYCTRSILGSETKQFCDPLANFVLAYTQHSLSQYINFPISHFLLFLDYCGKDGQRRRGRGGRVSPAP